jgi:hypothetical protein
MRAINVSAKRSAACTWSVSLASSSAAMGLALKNTLIELFRFGIHLAHNHLEHFEIASDHANEHRVICVDDAHVTVGIAICGNL